ncbi:g3043 [Coccomyxa viridis]|uniref:G3043 protein n=1 Tax=Coccomyxa viridis TaxID=1274662 RepID=A0ABP1FS89_9CHLO
MAAFVFKVFTLTIRTIAKPLSKRVEAYVLDHPTLRAPVVNLAQVLHRFEVRVNRGAEGKSGKVFVGDLSEENALELAGKVISESFLWLTASAVIFWEYERQKGKDTAKAAKEKAFQEANDEDKRRLERRELEMSEELRDLKERYVSLEANMAQILELLQMQDADKEAQKLKRSNSFYGVFGLSK